MFHGVLLERGNGVNFRQTKSAFSKCFVHGSRSSRRRMIRRVPVTGGQIGETSRGGSNGLECIPVA